jgi:hypothetical protein
VRELREPLRRTFDPPLAHVDAAERAAIGRDHGRRRAIPRADIEHVPELEQGGDPAGKRLPGPARRIIALELVGQRLRDTAAALGLELQPSFLVGE